MSRFIKTGDTEPPLRINDNYARLRCAEVYEPNSGWVIYADDGQRIEALTMTEAFHRITLYEEDPRFQIFSERAVDLRESLRRIYAFIFSERT